MGDVVMVKVDAISETFDSLEDEEAMLSSSPSLGGKQVI